MFWLPWVAAAIMLVLVAAGAAMYDVRVRQPRRVDNELRPYLKKMGASTKDLAPILERIRCRSTVD